MGFSSASHFTRNYKLMFGELPSQTCRLYGDDLVQGLATSTAVLQPLSPARGHAASSGRSGSAWAQASAGDTPGVARCAVPGARR